MYGKNPILKKDHGDGKSLWLHSVFDTIQGEGPFAGRPATFVRLAGCNLQCKFCDTDFEMPQLVTPTSVLIDDLRARDNVRRGGLIVLTGGEPMRQNIAPLCLAFETTNPVQVETAGTYDLELPGNVTIVCSPKTPKVNAALLPKVAAWKYLVSDGMALRDNGLPAHVYAPPEVHLARTWVQPIDEYDDVKNELNVDLATRICIEHGYRLSVQVHKMVGVP